MKRAFLLGLLLLVAASPLLGCRQACCVWDETKASVQGVLPKHCCPDATGTVYTDPIYSGGCAGDNRIGHGGTGAFRTP
jgi:hypothetical protein